MSIGPEGSAAFDQDELGVRGGDSVRNMPLMPEIDEAKIRRARRATLNLSLAERSRADVGCDLMEVHRVREANANQSWTVSFFADRKQERRLHFARRGMVVLRRGLFGLEIDRGVHVALLCYPSALAGPFVGSFGVALIALQTVKTMVTDRQ